MAMNEGFNLVSRAVAASSTPRVKTRSNWAKVETIDPLTIILDEDASETPREVSENAVGLLEVNQRVRFAHEDKRLVITEAPDKVDRRFSSRIPAGADLNNYLIPGNYYNPLNVEVAGFTNGPPSNAAGALVVLQSTEPGVIQFWHGFDDDGTESKIYRRRLYSGSWSAWKLMNPASWVGSVSGGQRSGVTFYNVTLNFPSGLFSVAPKVFAQINNQAGGSNQLQVMTGSITTSSCLVGFFMTTGTMSNHWCEADVFAIEPS